jgi:hypothetical protein
MVMNGSTPLHALLLSEHVDYYYYFYLYGAGNTSAKELDTVTCMSVIIDGVWIGEWIY